MASESQRRTVFHRFAAIGSEQLRIGLLLPVFCLAYFVAAKVGIATSMPPEGIVILWPPNAIVLATLLAMKREHWWLFFLATVATEIAADVPDYPLWAATGYGIVNFSEAAIAAVLLARFVRDTPLLAGLRDFVAFIAVGPILASGTAALFGAAIYKIGAPDLDYLHYWRVFWMGDALGLLIVGTTLLAWRRPADTPGLNAHAVAEGAVLALGLLGALFWAFLADVSGPRAYLVFPFLVWAALRFGVRGASVALVTTVAIAIGAAISGLGPFADMSEIATVMSLQGLLGVVALSTFLLAFATEESLRASEQLQHSVDKLSATDQQLREANAELERINRDLDQRVADRTGKLRKSVAHNEMLLREIHHRVKNNLQLIASLLGLHSRSVSDPALQGRFAEVQGQIAAIASTYDILHRMESVEVVDLCDVVPELCRNIDGATGETVSLSVRTDGEAPVSADAAVAVSLAVNELVTNSIKHAVGDGRATVAVSCRRSGGNVLVTVSDDGPGFPPDFDFDHSGGFGIRMVRDLVRRAGGRLRLVPSDEDGAVAEISVPCEPKQPSASAALK